MKSRRQKAGPGIQNSEFRIQKPASARRGSFAHLPRTIYHLLFFLAFASVGQAQTDYSVEIGSPTFATADPVPNGMVNLANGNLHLEIPLQSFSQRGSISFTAKMVYDSRIWEVVSNGSSQVWSPSNVSNSQGGGWRFGTTADAGGVAYGTTVTTCPTGSYTTYWPFWWYLPDGTTRKFGIATRQDNGCGVGNVTSGDAFAEDSTGFHMYVTNSTTAKVVANDGGVVFDGTQSTYTVKDPNGNFFSTDVNGNVVDTVGRTPVVKTSGGANITYYDVLNSQGTRSRFTVTTTAIDVCTSFGQTGVTEYCSAGVPSNQITVIQSIALPDGTSYAFTYDSGTLAGNYGLLQSVTLPTGGVVNYTHTTFSDAYGDRNRWLNTRTSGGGTWTYTGAVVTTCTPGGVGCQQKNTVSRPSGDDTVYTFTLNNGGWNTQTASYKGSSSTGTLLRSVTTDFDFSNACPLGCSGAAYIRRIRVTTSDASTGGNLTKKSEYSYDSPQNGNVTATKEWKYAAAFSASPDRETDFTYLTAPSYISKNIINRVTDKIVKDSSGTRVAETATTYDSTALASVTGVTHHDDTNYGAGNAVRGNPTLIQQWVSGTAYLSTTSYFDTTGQVTQVTDPAGNSTTYSYADTFFNDSGSNPPQPYSPATPTNAYRTRITLPVSGSQTFGYYYGSGKLASSTNQNGAATYQHYLDSLDRQTHTYLPAGGWRLTAYTTATQQDSFTGLTDATPSTACTGCRHDNTILDGLGRVIEKLSPSDPAGGDFIDTNYDSSGRVASVSNPYRTPTEPTYGADTRTYDGLDRLTQIVRPDGNSANTFYGAAVGGGGGLASQLCASATYGLGYPALTVDEAGRKRQRWIDGFGRTIEVDEPDSSGNLTLATCYKYNVLNNPTEVDQGVQVRTYAYDGLSRETSETTPEAGTTNFYFTTVGGALCAANTKAVCRRTDARGVTITYAYDAENRLTSKTYSDGTPTASLFYDETSVTVGGTAYTLTNTKGRLSHTSTGTPTAITVHSYDSAGRLVDLWQCTPFNCSSASIWNMHYTYNLAGDVSTWSHPAGFTITNSISTARRISQISSSLNDATHPGTLATITYTAFGTISTLQNGCAGTGCTLRQETYDYNNRLQATRIQLGTPASPAANSCLVYNYYSGVANPTTCAIPSQATTGDTGNVIGHFYQDTTNPSLGNTESFAYDPLNRLTSSVATGSSTQNLTFSYDRYGNMTCVSGPQTQGPCPNWTFNVATNKITNANFTYDAAGNLTQDGTGVGTHTYQWDAENRLKSVDNGTAATYVYNALGLRVEKQVGATYSEVIYNSGSEPVGENNRTTWTQSFVPFNGRHLAHYQSGVTYFPHANTLKSTTAVTDYSGAMTQDQLYYPFGQEWAMAGTMQEDRFAQLGHRDAESALDPTFFRVYSSGEGRWLTTDPKSGFISNPQSFNLYGYVRSNPENRTDPRGDCPTTCGDFGDFFCALDLAVAPLIDLGSVFDGGGGDDQASVGGIPTPITCECEFVFGLIRLLGCVYNCQVCSDSKPREYLLKCAFYDKYAGNLCKPSIVVDFTPGPTSVGKIIFPADGGCN